MKKKILVPVVASAMLVSAMIGGTLAYLTDTTTEVKNTFTIGNVDIDLTEEAGKKEVGGVVSYEFKMVPGKAMDKDPKVSVLAGSDACWLFVKAVKSDNLDTYILYDVYDGIQNQKIDLTKYPEFEDDAEEGNRWEQLSGTTDVWYRKVAATDAKIDFQVLTANKVITDKDVTNALMKAADGNEPTLTFKAYAIQEDGFATPEAAWEEIGE